MEQQQQKPTNEIERLPLDTLWERLHKSESKSLLKKHLKEDVYKRLKDKKTKLGGTLADCIQSGCKNLDSNVGLYACDPDAYETFGELFDAVIKDYHKVPSVTHPGVDFGNLKDLKIGNLDPENKFIISTRVRVGRSHDGKHFPPGENSEERKEMETATIAALNTLTGDLAGKYFSLETMSKEEEEELINDHFLFKNDDRFLREAFGYEGWPVGRGIYFSKDKKFLAWINEEDHLRFISMEKGGDLETVYKRLVTALQQLETKLTFAHDPKRGYLTFCPTNLGTTCRASVHIKVPKLEKTGKLNEVCDKLNLQARGIHGEHTDSVGGVYDISNKRRLGLTEIQALTEMAVGIKSIIEQEKALK